MTEHAPEQQAQLEAILEEALAEGLIEVVGTDERGRTVYRGVQRSEKR